MRTYQDGTTVRDLTFSEGFMVLVDGKPYGNVVGDEHDMNQLVDEANRADLSGSKRIQVIKVQFAEVT